MTRLVFAGSMLCLVVLSSPPLAAQTTGSALQVGAQLATSVSGQFDSADVGVGGWLGWQLTPLVGVESELTFYPRDFAGRPAFSGHRVEGLFGATVGPRLGRLRPFARARPGFLVFGEAPQPIGCIAVFPPPLSCTLADGRTLFALDLGGGLEWRASGRSVVRVDAGDRLVRYPTPVIDGSGVIHDDTLRGHDFRLTIGAGWRF